MISSVRISSVSMGPIRLGSEKVWVRFVLGPKRFWSESSQKFWVRVVLGPSCLTFYSIPMLRRPSVRPSSVRRPPFSKIFFSETAWPIKAKFYMKHLWEGGTNVYINNPGHMTKMAAMPIYGKKTLQKSSSPEPLDGFQPKLA